MPNTAHHDLHSKKEPPDALKKVQRWFHLRRLFALDFGWHTKDFRLTSITETEPNEFSCTFKPRYLLYRRFLPLLLGHAETMPVHCLNRMMSRAAHAIMRDRSRLPGRAWGIQSTCELKYDQPIMIGPNSRITINIKLKEHSRAATNDKFTMRCAVDNDDNVATENFYCLLDKPTCVRTPEEELPEINSTEIDARRYPYRFPTKWIRQNSMFILNHGWQLKEYRPKILEQAGPGDFTISFRPRYRFIRMLAPLLLKRPERMAIDCSLRMLERIIYPILRLSGQPAEMPRPFITNLKIKCKQPITVRSGILVPVRLELIDEDPPLPPNRYRFSFSIGKDQSFQGELECATESNSTH